MTTSSDRPTTYRIVVRGRLTRRLEAAFDGMAIKPGDRASAIVGPVSDQSQLLGLLERATGLGLELISLAPDAESAPTPA